MEQQNAIRAVVEVGGGHRVLTVWTRLLDPPLPPSRSVQGRTLEFDLEGTLLSVTGFGGLPVRRIALNDSYILASGPELFRLDLVRIAGLSLDVRPGDFLSLAL